MLGRRTPAVPWRPPHYYTHTSKPEAHEYKAGDVLTYAEIGQFCDEVVITCAP